MRKQLRKVKQAIMRQFTPPVNEYDEFCRARAATKRKRCLCENAHKLTTW